MLRDHHFDEIVVTQLQRLPEQEALDVLSELARHELVTVKNVPAYIMGIINRWDTGEERRGGDGGVVVVMVLLVVVLLVVLGFGGRVGETGSAGWMELRVWAGHGTGTSEMEDGTLKVHVRVNYGVSMRKVSKRASWKAMLRASGLETPCACGYACDGPMLTVRKRIGMGGLELDVTWHSACVPTYAGTGEAAAARAAGQALTRSGKGWELGVENGPRAPAVTRGALRAGVGGGFEAVWGFPFRTGTIRRLMQVAGRGDTGIVANCVKPA